MKFSVELWIPSPLQNFPYSVFKRRGKPESIQEKLRNTPKCQIRHQKITTMFSLYQRRITMNHEEKKENGKKCFKGCVTFYLHSGYISFCFESKLPGAARPLQVLAFHPWIGKGLLLNPSNFQKALLSEKGSKIYSKAKSNYVFPNKVKRVWR